MIIGYRLKVFLILAIGCYSGPQPTDNDVVILKKNLQICKQKITQVKTHLKNTRQNNQVFQRMLQGSTQNYKDSESDFFQKIESV